MLHLLKGPVLGHITEDRRRKKAQHLTGFEPMTSRVLLQRRVLYRCATTTARLNSLSQETSLRSPCPPLTSRLRLSADR